MESQFAASEKQRIVSNSQELKQTPNFASFKLLHSWMNHKLPDLEQSLIQSWTGSVEHKTCPVLSSLENELKSSHLVYEYCLEENFILST